MVIAASLLGALTGIVTGLVPGIHVNTVTALLLASSASCASLGIEYSALLAFTCALAISHTFFDVVPGLFLGVPGDESFALLPGHRLVRQGRGTLALRLSVAGSVLGLGIGLVVVTALLLFGNLIGTVEEAIGPWMFFVLAGVSLVLIVSDSRRGWSFVVFLTSGLLGVAVFASPLVAGGLDAPVNALFPALAGLFGVAGLLFAIGTARDGEMPPPPDVPASPTATGVAWPGVRGGLAGLLVGVLPGLGAANAATLLLLLEQWFGRRGNRDAQDRAYLVTTSSLNTSEALFAIAALYLIGRSRSGASIAVEQILGGIVSPADLGWIALFMIAAGVVAAVIMWRTGRAVAARFQAVDQTGLNGSVVAFLVALTLLLLGAGGLVILICATAIGLIPLLFGVRRAQLMGFFLVPTMLFYSGFQVTLVDRLALEQRTAPLFPSITLTGIALALIASIGVALSVYHLAGRIGVGPGGSTRGGDSGRFPSAGRIAGAATTALAGAVLLFALLGGAYPANEAGSVAPLTPPARAEGRIERVIDADTADIASACRRFRVRLSGVDAPELGRPEGERARDWARSTLEDRAVSWSAVGVDAYGRILGLLELADGTSVNEEIIREGYARPFDQPSAETPRPAATEPNQPAAPSSPPVAPAQSSELLPWDDNGNGRVSCSEARAHGIAPVRRGHPAYPYMTDGDGDGVVCE